MSRRFVFVGFRHPHIFSLWQGVRDRSDCEIVGACEVDPVTRTSLAEGGRVKITHDNFERMLAETPSDVVAIGDVFGERGTLAILALESGRHVIADKPICTRLKELDRIERLAGERRLVVGAQLDLPENPAICRLRQVINDGMIGAVCTVTIAAQHPLRWGTRPPWYFEPDRHGGTINDLGVHVFDLVPWLTGRGWERLLSAHVWNAKAVAAPQFQDGAQFLATLQGGISCFADLSYLGPDLLGYEIPNYWRITVHGTQGLAEMSLPQNLVRIIRDDAKTPEEMGGLPGAPLQYLNDFLDETAGRPRAEGMNTERVLAASRLALKAQAAAESGAMGAGLHLG
jgi:predicted dehydrogenase